MKVRNGKKTCTCDFCFTYLGTDILDVSASCDKKCKGNLEDIEVGGPEGEANLFIVSMKVNKGKAEVTDADGIIGKFSLLTAAGYVVITLLFSRSLWTC